MKKLKILATCLIFALVATGFTYAVWSQQLIINGTVATGNFGFEWDPPNCWAAPFDRDDTDGQDITYSVDRDEAQKNRLVVTMSNIYPGAGIKLDAKGINNGTIPAKFNNATITFSDEDSPLIPYLRSKGTFGWNKTGTGSAIGRDIQQPDSQTGIWPQLNAFDDGMNRYLTDNPDNPYQTNREVIINQGGWFALDEIANPDSPNCIYIKLDESTPKELAGQSITFTLTANFVQAQ